MLLNPKISSDLFNAWTNDQKHPHKGRANREIPSIKQFGILLDTLFQTSLLQEEGVPISASVAWISKQHFQKLEIPKMRETELCLYFDVPIIFEARNLAKMNGIANGRSSALLAYGDDDNNAKIWGICYFETLNKIIGEIPAQAPCTRHFAPDCPLITISGVGSLEITRSESVIARVEGGRLIPTHPAVFSSGMLGRYLYELTEMQIDFKTRKFKSNKEATIARTYMSCVEYLVELLSRRRFGATIILCPGQVDIKRYFDSPWSVKGTMQIDFLQERKLFYAETKDYLFELKISESLRSRLNNLIDLANMDGALILTHKLEVAGFGAKLKAPKWEGPIEPGPIPCSNADQSIDFTRLGTRHNSALNFVGSVNGAIAFVSSSDGPIRALVKSDDGKVLYWSDSRISMFK